MSFVFHFLLPWLVLLFVIVHIAALHRVGRTSSLYYSGSLEKGWFWPYFGAKDLLSFIFIFIFLIFVFIYPFYLRDPEIFIEANKIISPVHIVPEWYFCAHYGLLRSIPNKGLGVFLLIFSMLGFIFFCFMDLEVSIMRSFNKVLVTGLLFSGVGLGWLGQCPAVSPYVEYSGIFRLLYFLFFFFLLFFCFFTEKLFSN